MIDGFTDYPIAFGRQTYQDSVFRSWAAGNITADPMNAESWVERVPGKRLSFRTKGQEKSVSLIPLNRLFGERYAVYWKVRAPAV